MSLEVPEGFRLTGVHCGVKQDPAKNDLMLVVCDQPTVAAGVYTKNLVFAAPVELDRQRTPSADIRTVVANSGNANSCTGERGLEDAHTMARLAAQACGVQADQALVMSTGLIGEYLPMDNIAAGITDATAKLGNDPACLEAAARGIMTTDKAHKLSARQLTLGGRPVQITGMVKGAGMIGPHMATMLGLVMTDAALTPADAQAALEAAVDQSFNCISVEGHMSTNDTVLLLASGARGTEPLAGNELAAFTQGLREVCEDLARGIAAGGEGAKHLITLDVCGTRTKSDAHQIAKTVANSLLVKTSVAGADPDWGQILSAAGYAGVPMDPALVDVFINDMLVCRQGGPVEFDEAAVSASMRDSTEINIRLQLGEGVANCRYWTCDITAEYVRFNTDLHT